MIAAIYEACLAAAKDLGGNLKGLSWFGKNAKQKGD